MKQLLKYVLAIMVSLGLIVPTYNEVNASSRTYEVTFKAGSKGEFDAKDLKGNYQINDEHTSITYKVQAGDRFPNVPTVIANEGYRHHTWNKELPLVGSAVEEKQVYVAKYTKLVNAVEFTVSYVDTNGVEIATPTIYTTDLNTEELVRAKTIEGYQPDALQKRLVVSRENVEIQFVYTSLEEATEPPVIEQIVEVEGEPVYKNVIVSSVTGGTGTGNTTGTTNTVGQENVDDNETPLGGGDATENVDDNETPLAKGEQGSNQMLYIAGGVGVLAIIALIIYMTKKKKEETN